MGAMKELMMDLRASEPTNLQVSFLCPTCGHPAAAFLEVPGDEDDYFGEVTCLNPEEYHEWAVRIRKKDNVYVAQLEHQPDVDVSLSLVDLTADWDEPSPEPGAYGIFLEALDDWGSNVNKLCKPDGGSSGNRMLFSSLYSILEAYLSDTIRGAAFVDTSVQRQMLKLNILKDKQISLATVLDQPNIVRDMIDRELQALSFHSLERVNSICAAAFRKPILPATKEDRDLIMKSVAKRHDCVHRNGLDKDGNKHNDITPEYLRRVEAIFEGMAKSLESAIQDAAAKRFFEGLGPDGENPM